MSLVQHKYTFGEIGAARTWLDASGYYRVRNKRRKAVLSTTNDNAQETCNYTMLDCGTACVPDFAEKEWLQKLVEDFQVKHWNCVSVYGEKIFSLFFEFDADDMDEWGNAEKLLIGACLQKAVSRFIKPPHQLAVCVKTDDRNGKIHNNLHFFWLQSSGVFLDMEYALWVREYAIYLLQQEGPERPAIAKKSWDDIIDSKVLTQSRVHIRMNFQAKYVNCSTCPPDEKFCVDCRGKKKRYDCSYYKVQWVLNEDGTTNADETQRMDVDLLYQLKQTTIRTQIQELRSDFHVPPNAPTPKYFTHNAKPNKSARTLIEKGAQLTKNGVNKKRKQTTDDGETVKSVYESFSISQHGDDAPIFEAVTDAIRNSHDLWKDIELEKITCSIEIHSRHRSYSVIPKSNSPGAHACMNREGYRHSSAIVFFVITCQGVSQRCLGSKTKQENRHFKPCGLYCSTAFKLGTRQLLRLFPPQNKGSRTNFEHNRVLESNINNNSDITNKIQRCDTSSSLSSSSSSCHSSTEPSPTAAAAAANNKLNISDSADFRNFILKKSITQSYQRKQVPLSLPSANQQETTSSSNDNITIIDQAAANNNNNNNNNNNSTKSFLYSSNTMSFFRNNPKFQS